MYIVGMDIDLFLKAICIVAVVLMPWPFEDKISKGLLDVELFPKIKKFFIGLTKPEPYDGCTPPPKNCKKN